MLVDRVLLSIKIDNTTSYQIFRFVVFMSFAYGYSVYIRRDSNQFSIKWCVLSFSIIHGSSGTVYGAGS